MLFADIVGFTQRARSVGAVTTLAILNYFFKAADLLSERHGCEKIKTIGDCVMVVAGLPAARSDHAEALAHYALELRKAVKRERFAGEPIRLRIGIHSGPIVAGVIGKRRFAYDLWGETVNLASRIRTSADPMKSVFPMQRANCSDQNLLATHSRKRNCVVQVVCECGGSRPDLPPGSADPGAHASHECRGTFVSRAFTRSRMATATWACPCEVMRIACVSAAISPAVGRVERAVQGGRQERRDRASIAWILV